MDEVRQLTSKNVDEKMEDMEEKSADVIEVTRRKIADVEEKASEMDRKMRIETHGMKA